jgi:2-polyprenyl-3-methyl-5-hydroxy-6-metoxy-1,4-benzoquinol methylase
MTKQAEREIARRVDQSLLFKKPFNEPRVLREFALALDLFQELLPAGGALLDLGCGPGWTSLFLARAGFDVTGVDISDRMIEVATQRAAQENVNVRFAVADMEEMQLEKTDFDAVFIFDALHHCPGHATVLERACAHLRPGGCLLLMEPSWLHLYSPHARAITRNFGVTELGFTRFGLKRELRQAGFHKITLYHDAGRLYRGLGGFILANLRLWCAYLCCYPQVKQIVLAQK